MAQCVYCRRTAGFRRRMHAECRERHDRAIAQIPEFFPKFFQSDLPIDRFGELLRGAAEASFVRRDEFTELAAQGMSNVIDTILGQRLLTGSEMQRLQDVARSLAPILSRDIVPHETFAKIDILHELADAKIPDLVSVSGPLPVELRRGESVIWIFNYVSCYRDVGGAEEAQAKGEHPGVPLALEGTPYYGLSAFKEAAVPRTRLRQDANGDFIVTNHNLFFINSDVQTRRIPIARIASLRAYADGIYIACEPFAERTRTFGLGDSWLAANMLVRLVQMVRR